MLELIAENCLAHTFHQAQLLHCPDRP